MHGCKQRLLQPVPLVEAKHTDPAGFRLSWLQRFNSALRAVPDSKQGWGLLGVGHTVPPTFLYQTRGT